MNTLSCFRQHIYGTWDASFRNLIESTIDMSFLSPMKLFMESFTGVGQQVGQPHSPKHHYTVYAEPTYIFFLLEFASPHAKWCYTDVYSGPILFNVPRQDLLWSCDLHSDLDAQASTGPRSTQRRRLWIAELRCVCVRLAVSFDGQCTVGHPFATRNIEVLINPYTLAGRAIFFFKCAVGPGLHTDKSYVRSLAFVEVIILD